MYYIQQYIYLFDKFQMLKSFSEKTLTFRARETLVEKTAYFSIFRREQRIVK